MVPRKEGISCVVVLVEISFYVEVVHRFVVDVKLPCSLLLESGSNDLLAGEVLHLLCLGENKCCVSRYQGGEPLISKFQDSNEALDRVLTIQCGVVGAGWSTLNRTNIYSICPDCEKVTSAQTKPCLAKVTALRGHGRHGIPPAGRRAGAPETKTSGRPTRPAWPGMADRPPNIFHIIFRKC